VIASREKQIERIKAQMGAPPVKESKAIRLKFEEKSKARTKC
jgi:hypothetical protein